ncbi:MAG: hypothetical protein IKZ58_02825 [Selenomonadaceae bacterium]|nr:hypothetical protein [Selenomonadaceae bacterium]
MANREENLKKINEELEKLSDEELDKVAGGNYNQTGGDSFLLNKLGLCNYYDPIEIQFTIGTSKEQEVQAAWKACGVNFIWHGDGKDNEYYIGTRKVSRREAAWHAVKAVGSDINPERMVNLNK